MWITNTFLGQKSNPLYAVRTWHCSVFAPPVQGLNKRYVQTVLNKSIQTYKHHVTK